MGRNGKSEGRIILFHRRNSQHSRRRKNRGFMDAGKTKISERRASLHGATTLDEYRKYIERCGTGEKVSKSHGGSADGKNTISILRGLKEKLKFTTV